MKIEDVIEHFGSTSKAAEATGMTKEAIRQWSMKKSIPNRSQIKIEVITNGALKSEFKKSKCTALDAVLGTYGTIDRAHKQLGIPIINICRWVVNNYIPVCYYEKFPSFFCNSE